MEITTIAPFLKYFDNVRERTMRVALLVPPDKIDWTYAPGKFTCGDLLRHIAVTERFMFAENIQNRQGRYTTHGKELAADKETILELMKRLHAESLAIFASLTDEDLRRKCKTPAGVDIQTAKWLRAMIEHEVHHRGQIYLYLGLLGVRTPPLYGLTSEEVRARSVAD
jgi:uncharacterized damage-inducible protein DinB